MHLFILHLVIFLVLVALAIAAVLYFDYKARAKAKALVLSELALIRAAEARTAAELGAKVKAKL
jgi:hypothetical protein